MLILDIGAESAIGARFGTPLVDRGDQLIRAHGTPRSVGRVRRLGTEPIGLGQPERAWRRFARSS